MCRGAPLAPTIGARPRLGPVQSEEGLLQQLTRKLKEPWPKQGGANNSKQMVDNHINNSKEREFHALSVNTQEYIEQNQRKESIADISFRQGSRTTQEAEGMAAL